MERSGECKVNKIFLRIVICIQIYNENVICTLIKIIIQPGGSHEAFITEWDSHVYQKRTCEQLSCNP